MDNRTTGIGCRKSPDLPCPTAGSTRRDIMYALGSSALGAGALFLGACAARATPTKQPGRQGIKRRRVGKVDFHHHFNPPFWAESLRDTPYAGNLREWSPQASLAFMDENAIQAALLSLTTPDTLPWDLPKQVEMLRKVNEYGADLVSRNPQRFGLFAALPMSDIDAALRETEHAFDGLRADGVILMANIGDSYVGDKNFAPLWAELERRAAVVLIHPNNLALRPIAGVPPALIDYPLSTVRAAVDMVVNAMITPQSRMKVVLSHGGGFLPFISQRLIDAGSSLPGAPDAATLRRTYRCFYYDTTISSSAPSLAALTRFAAPERIVFGSDFPYGAGSAGIFTRALETSEELSDPQYHAIAHDNAARLFPGRFGG